MKPAAFQKVRLTDEMLRKLIDFVSAARSPEADRRIIRHESGHCEGILIGR